MALIGDSVLGVAGPHGWSMGTSDNGERLVEFEFARAKSSLKDSVLVKHRLRTLVKDTRVFRGGGLDSDHRLAVVTLCLKLEKSNQRRGNDSRQYCSGRRRGGWSMWKL